MSDNTAFEGDESPGAGHRSGETSAGHPTDPGSGGEDIMSDKVIGVSIVANSNHPGSEVNQVHKNQNGTLDEDKKKMSRDDHELSETLLDISNGNAKFIVERPVFSQQKFDEGFVAGSRPQKDPKKIVKKQLSKCACSKNCFVKFLYSMFPFVKIMKNYQKDYIFGDIVSGLTVGIMHIPQGMAYGMLTGLPAIYGLYVSFFPVLIYFFFGSSRHISIGTFAVASLMVGSAIEKHITVPPAMSTTMSPMAMMNSTASIMNSTSNTTDTAVDATGGFDLEQEQLKWAMAITLMTGFIQLGMAITRLGFVTIYLADPLISGFTTGAACHVFTSQIKHVFGVYTDNYSGALKLVYTYIDFFTKIGNTNYVTIIISIVFMVLIYCVKEFINNNPKLKPKMKMPVPIDLIVVVLGTVISYLLNLEEKNDVSIVGDIPTGLPSPTAPDFSLLPEVITDAIAIAIVVFAVSVSMGKILSKKYDYEINANQELVAYSACNIFGSFFSCYVSSASLSRSLVQEGVGGKTQVAGLLSSALLLLVLLLLGPYFKTLPKCILAAIIIIALKGMFKQLLELPRLWKLSKIDFFLWVVTFIATVILDVDLGLMVGVVVAVLSIVFRVQRPYVCRLGQIPDTDIYRDVSVYQEAKEVPDIKIFRFESPLFFVSVENFRSSVYKYTVNPKKLKKAMKSKNPKKSMEAQVTFSSLVLDCSAWGFVDSMGVKALGSMINEYKAVGISVYLALCKAGVREMFEKTGFFDILDREKLFVTIHDAVLHAQHSKILESQTDQNIVRHITDEEIEIIVNHDPATDAKTNGEKREESKL